jgi:hypothetical protein
VTGGVTAALAGLYAPAIFVALVGVSIAVLFYRNAPDVVFDDPPAKVIPTRSSSPGMTETEMYRRLAIHGEREDMKEEKIERERKRQRRQAKSRSH